MLPEVKGWIIEHFWRWFQRCERCGRRRILGIYFEVYGPTGTCWWYECTFCFVRTLTRVAEQSYITQYDCRQRRHRPIHLARPEVGDEEGSDEGCHS